MSKFADIQIDPGIVKRAARGDAKAHEIIYRAFSAPVYSVCLRFTRIPAQAEDLLQDTFMEVIRSIGKFRGDAPLGIWIRQVAVSKALMFLRSAWHKRGRSLDDDWEEWAAGPGTGNGNPVQPDQAIDLDAALGALPSVSRASRLAARRRGIHAQGDRDVARKDRKFFQVAVVTRVPEIAAPAGCGSDKSRVGHGDAGIRARLC
jgi:RNA polymerase sigma-70 factor (ECF subfamily)